ncbi:MAG: LysR family transcriptional regulator [Deltaproteobacteria bacterium]|nr:LysR family transcriptional regulator [Deltaproteobacteria bacterium]
MKHPVRHPPSSAPAQGPSVLGEVELLLAVDRHRSATKAAAELGTTAATVLRRLEAVEATLGVVLFDRLPTGMRATPAMALVRPWAEQAVAAGASLVRELLQVEQKPAGVVRLAAPPAIASLFIVPALPSLRRSFPDLVIELAPATATVDLVMREADLAIRTVRPDRGDLVLHKLGTVKLAVVCAPSLAKQGLSLHDLPWVAWDRALAHIPEMLWLSKNVPQANVVFRSTELSTLLVAAQRGIGALVVAEPLAKEAGGLVTVDTPSSMPEGAVWLVSHRALRQVPRVAATWDWIAGSALAMDRAPPAASLARARNARPSRRFEHHGR